MVTFCMYSGWRINCFYKTAFFFNILSIYLLCHVGARRVKNTPSANGKPPHREKHTLREWKNPPPIARRTETRKTCCRMKTGPHGTSRMVGMRSSPVSRMSSNQCAPSSRRAGVAKPHSAKHGKHTRKLAATHANRSRGTTKRTHQRTLNIANENDNTKSAHLLIGPANPNIRSLQSAT